jgi:hypothetical protein
VAQAVVLCFTFFLLLTVTTVFSVEKAEYVNFFFIISLEDKDESDPWVSADGSVCDKEKEVGIMPSLSNN